MAKEIKSVSVAPSAEEETINVWQSFGWEFKSTQDVKTHDVQVFTGQDSDGTEHYRTTRGEHYVKITFERDPTRKNYSELVALEKQYYTVPDPGIRQCVLGNYGLSLLLLDYLYILYQEFWLLYGDVCLIQKKANNGKLIMITG